MSSSSSEQEPVVMSSEDEGRSLVIPYEELKSATNNFADENLISQNTFYRVYKGQLSHSGELIDIVARKCLKESVGVNEMMMSKDIKHKNIVSIFELAVDDNDDDDDDDGLILFIINKLEANGSLDKHLSGSALTWIQRLHICLCVADALRYIHNLEDDECVIHGNIKSSHILLDHNWEPKLNGFGFAIRVKKHHLHLTSEYNGSIEYMDPEYEKTGGLTHKSDVFSFGIVLFEVLFGRKASSMNPIPDDGDKWYFARLARSHYESRTLDDMMDPDLRKQMDLQSLKIFSETAYCCLKVERALRPDMDQIYKELARAFELQEKYQSIVRSSNHLKGKNMDHFRIRFSDIEFATNKFSTTNRIGSGGYGIVYKAELDHFDCTISSTTQVKSNDDFLKRRSVVAIKRLFIGQEGVEGFFTEIEMLTNCKHRNIVSLLGFCEEGHERILVYEHVSNGSLSDYFEKINNEKRLTWAQRIQICLDIAHGLDYLHSSTEEKQMIIHRDIKSDNILLDNNWVAKIADFGLSKLRPSNQKSSTLKTLRIAGTEVYLDPEYLKTGKLKKGTDVYSFGVVLFEIVSGKLAYDESYNENGFRSTIQMHFNEGTLKKIVDPNLMEAPEDILMPNGGVDQKSLETFFDIAYQCLADTQDERPTTHVIIHELKKALNYQENRKDGFHISLKDINSATTNFSDDKCIREGRCWKQYEGEIPHANGFTIAIVKRWDKKSSQARHQYLTELKVFSESKHQNIVALVGHCNESNERIIVYEHAANGTLHKHLDDVSLTWIKRLKICMGIASGLKYIHEGVGMIHRDIKSSSILLDADWEPKICNFELCSKTLELLKTEHATDNAYGSLGYLDPMHEELGYLAEASDVYSLGVVLMEMLCGRLAWGEECKSHLESLGPLARRLYEEGNLDELVFSGIKEQIYPKLFTAFASIAVQCLDERDNFRPKASDVVEQLKKIYEIQENYEKLHITLEDIILGTENFTNDKLIREGRYWKQYTGVIPHANAVNGLTTVVIKRFNTKSDQGSNQFFVELRALFDYEHENIIRVAGYCLEMNEKIIVYEHAPNGTLSNHLNDTSLTWSKRLNICIDVATGLNFLHEGGREGVAVIHTDINSGSILIDREWKAIISNLELSEKVWTTEETSRLEQTYANNSFNDLSGTDIYALGVVLVELLCGKLARGEECKDHSQSLGPLAVRHYYEKGILDELVFEGIKAQIYEPSLMTYADIAIRCLDLDQWLWQRPSVSEVIVELQKSLKYQEDYETWETKLPKDYEELMRSSKTTHMHDVFNIEKKDIYDTLRKGFHLQNSQVHFSLGNNGEKNFLISATKFAFKNRRAVKWRHIPQSRFQKVAKMLSIRYLNIHIKMETAFLSPDVNYVVHLIFKFCHPRKSSSNPFMNLTYKVGSKTFHAYYAIWRDKDWMKIELRRFLNHKKEKNFEVLLESFSQSYCGSDAIYVEGIEFQAINNLKHEDIEKTMDIQQQLPTDSDKRYEIDHEGGKLVSLNEVNGKLHFMLSVEVLYDSSNVKPFHFKSSATSRTQQVAELLRQQVFGIKCKIESQMLSPHTDYKCYLVFKLSKKCPGLHCPVRVRNVLQWKNKEIELVCFRPPNPWDLLVTNRVPKQREDGWMEVMVWKFNSASELRNDCIPMHLKLITYEGTMSGLIVSGLEIRPM